MLTACRSERDREIDNDGDKAQSESCSPYQNLTPEELLDALLKAEKFTITMATTFITGEAESVSSSTLMKNGSQLKFSNDQSGYTDEYVDLGKELIYFRNEIGGAWIVQSRVTDMNETLKSNFRGTLLYDSDSYGEYDSEINRYPMKSEALMNALFADSDTALEGYMTRKGSTYTFYISEDHGVYSNQSTITVEFTADIIQFPDVEAPKADEMTK